MKEHLFIQGNNSEPHITNSRATCGSQALLRPALVYNNTNTLTVITKKNRSIIFFMNYCFVFKCRHLRKLI